MKKYFNYLLYVLKHKFYVAIECFKNGLYWRGLVHDNSKFLPSEFFPYMERFYGKDKGGTPDPKFILAWLHHTRRNKHHWQYWVHADGKPISIPEPYLTEMVCDWMGVDCAKGLFSPKIDKYYYVKKWYHVNKDKMILSKRTRKLVENKIEYNRIH